MADTIYIYVQDIPEEEKPVYVPPTLKERLTPSDGMWAICAGIVIGLVLLLLTDIIGGVPVLKLVYLLIGAVVFAVGIYVGHRICCVREMLYLGRNKSNVERKGANVQTSL